MTQSHELDAEINSGSFTYLCEAMAEMILFPREMYFSAAVHPFPRDDQRSVSQYRIKAIHQFRPEQCPVFVK
jgi:hypothetical protein